METTAKRINAFANNPPQTDRHLLEDLVEIRNDLMGDETDGKSLATPQCSYEAALAWLKTIKLPGEVRTAVETALKDTQFSDRLKAAIEGQEQNVAEHLMRNPLSGLDVLSKCLSLNQNLLTLNTYSRALSHASRIEDKHLQKTTCIALFLSMVREHEDRINRSDNSDLGKSEDFCKLIHKIKWIIRTIWESMAELMQEANNEEYSNQNTQGILTKIGYQTANNPDLVKQTIGTLQEWIARHNTFNTDTGENEFYV
jgi:hypothetical protein